MIKYEGEAPEYEHIDVRTPYEARIRLTLLNIQPEFFGWRGL
jgi:hypothetical protein